MPLLEAKYVLLWSHDIELARATDPKVSQLATPRAINALNSVSAPANTFLVFYSNIENGQMWCPDCRDVEDVVKATFDGEDKPKAAIYWVGSISQWRDKGNSARVDFNVQSVPTIIRFTDGTETGRLVENEILDKSRLAAFVQGQ